MVMAALTALKSTNFVFDIILPWLFDCDELCGSRSELLPNGILTSAQKISRRANLPILASSLFWKQGDGCKKTIGESRHPLNQKKSCLTALSRFRRGLRGENL